MDAKEAIQKIKVLLNLEQAPAEVPAEEPAEVPAETPEVNETPEDVPAEAETPADPAPAQFSITEEQFNALNEEINQLKSVNEASAKKAADLQEVVTQLFSLVEKLMDQPEADPLEPKKDGFRAALKDSRMSQADKIKDAFSQLNKQKQ